MKKSRLTACSFCLTGNAGNAGNVRQIRRKYATNARQIRDKYAASTGNVRERRGGASEREFQLINLVVERQPVMGREAVLADRQPMLARRIALVLRPAVLGKLFGDAEHVLVTMGFGKHRSRGNVGVFAIALDDLKKSNFGYVLKVSCKIPSLLINFVRAPGPGVILALGSISAVLPSVHIIS